MAVLIQLVVERRASPYAGLRSTLSGKGQPKQITNAINPCEASILSFSPAAQRLRSTMRCSEPGHHALVAIVAPRGPGR